MSPRPSSFRFGKTVVKRRGDVRDDERKRRLTPASALHDILDARDPSSIIRLADHLRGGGPRFAPPTNRDVAHATQSVERALRDGEIVGLRQPRPVGAYPAVGAMGLPEEFEPSVPATGPTFGVPEDTLTWFEVTFVDEAGTPLRSLDVTFTLSGRARRVSTDGRGTVRVDDVQGSMASVHPADCRSLRDALLGARSDEASAPTMGGALTYEVQEDMDPIPLYSELPCTVVLRAREGLWIGIELVDNHGRPVASAAYRVTPPRGAAVVGRLDSSGRARVDIVERGSCTVAFPEFDASLVTPGATDEGSS